MIENVRVYVSGESMKIIWKHGKGVDVLYDVFNVDGEINACSYPCINKYIYIDPYYKCFTLINEQQFVQTVSLDSMGLLMQVITHQWEQGIYSRAWCNIKYCSNVALEETGY